MKPLTFLFALFIGLSSFAQESEREIRIQSRYLNIPVQASRDRQVMKFEKEDKALREFVIRLAHDRTDYWVFADVSEWIGKKINIVYPEQADGLDMIYQSDEIAGADSLYRETNRPQFHFTTRRGWNNDPNGLVWYDGEYHLYYQHNPYEINWENMHWGHAVSPDLIHWTELPDALYPDELGTMFSGTATVDYNNSTGWKKGDDYPIIAAYTANGKEKQVQCIAYSNDRGRSFTKYDGNPVVDSEGRWESKHSRDPKIFWHQGTGKWIMVLFEEFGHSIYRSDDLKNWSYQSHVNGFWECPELFELPVDGNGNNKKWVMYGASGTYMIGEFDGKEFRPETEKLNYFSGKMYAAQTFNNIPESDGRRIQIGWGQISHPGMPFNQMMTFPTELTLRTTLNGIRLFSEPVRELEKLHRKSYSWTNLTMEEANNKLKTIQDKCLRIKMKVKLLEQNNFRFLLEGNPLVNYTFNHNMLNGTFYGGINTEDMTIDLELLIDRTSAEVFADRGKFSLIQQLPEPKDDSGLKFETSKSEISILYLEVHELKSIW